LNGNNTLDVSGFTTKSMNPAICAAMRKQLPVNRRMFFSQMKYFVSSDAEQDYRYAMGAEGAEIVDKYWTGKPQAYWAGVPIMDIPLLDPYPWQMKTWAVETGGTVAVDYPPVVANSQIVMANGASTYATPNVEDTNYSFVDATGVLTDINQSGTINITYQGSGIAFLTMPGNIVLGIGLNDIFIETDRNILTGQDYLVVRWRVDVGILDLDAAVIAYGIVNDPYTSY